MEEPATTGTSSLTASTASPELLVEEPTTAPPSQYSWIFFSEIIKNLDVYEEYIF